MKTLFNLLIILTVTLLISSCEDNNPDFPEIKGMVFIPDGEFLMGTDRVEEAEAMKQFGLRKKEYYGDARPVHKVSVRRFYIDKFEVTNSMYIEFVSDTGRQAPSHWKDGQFDSALKEHPVNNITWFDAYSYCYWAWKRLPTEAEWEMVARGPKGLEYPWGNEYDETYANLTEGKTTEVGSYKKDKSPYGVYDMAGNVMEWVEDYYKPYEGNTMVNKDFGEKYRVLRGGAGSSSGHYLMNKIFSSNSFRHYYIPTGAGNSGGVRCAKSIDKNFGKVVTK